MNRRHLHTLLALIVTAIGAILMTGKIVFDGEPGLIPLLLVALGMAWFLWARLRIPPRDK